MNPFRNSPKEFSLYPRLLPRFLPLFLLLTVLLITCGSDEDPPPEPAPPANALGTWTDKISVVGFSQTPSMQLDISLAEKDSSESSSAVKVDGIISIPFLFPCPLIEGTVITEDLTCPPSDPISFQSGEVRGSELTIETETTVTIRSDLPPLAVPFKLKGNIIEDEMTGSLEVIVVHTSVPGGEIRFGRTFELIREIDP